MGSSPKPPKTPKTNYKKDILSYIGGLQEGFPSVYELESEYRPKWQDLNLFDVSKFGLGAMGLAPQFTQGAAQQLGAAREAELGQMTGQAGLTRGLMAGLSPEQASAVQQAQQESQRAYAAAQGVTPEQQRMYQQTAREAAQASGRLGGNSAIAAEVMGRENVMAAKRAEAAQAGQRAYSQAGEFYTNPGLQALRSAPQSYTAGMGALGIGLTSGPASSGQFDYNMPLGFAQQMGGAQNQYNQAVYQTNLANQQAKAQMWSSIGSSLMGAGMNMAGGGFNFGGAGGGAGMQTAQSPWGNVRYSYI